MIRAATDHDAQDIFNMALAFSAQYGTPRPHHYRATDLLFAAISEGTVLVSEDRDGELTGVLVGIARPHPFMDYTMLASMFTWSFGKEGKALIEAFIALGRQLGVDAITSSTQTAFPGKTSLFMEAMGFQQVETGWQYNLR